MISDQTGTLQGAGDQDQALKAPKLGAGACAGEDTTSHPNSNSSCIVLDRLAPSRPCGDTRGVRLCNGQVVQISCCEH